MATGIAIDATRSRHLAGLDELSFREELQRGLGETFILRHVIGIGGFAIVYSAWDNSARRMVAIKALRPDTQLSREAVARFHREVVAAAAISHPNVMPVFAAGPADAPPYMVMPLVLGETLSSILKREGTLSVPITCHFAAQIADGLHAAHTSVYGLIAHRDVKPDNILIEVGAHKAIITDFGVAKIVERSAERLTHTGSVIGTLRYMSPEQAWGMRDIDHRSDQFALAAVMFECLVGEPPFVADSLSELQAKHAADTPPNVARLRPDVPSELSNAISRALSQDRESRYADMSQFAEAIREASAGFAAKIKSARLHHQALRGLRASTARALLTRWKKRAIVGGALGMIGFAGLHLWSDPRVMYAVGASRAEALFVARDAVKRSGGASPNRSSENLEFWGDDSLHQYLAGLVGRDSADIVERNTASVWYWHYQRYDWEAEKLWQVFVGPNGQIGAIIPPPSEYPQDSSQSGRYWDGLRFLNALGVDTTGLTLVSGWDWDARTNSWATTDDSSRWVAFSWVVRHSLAQNGRDTARKTYDLGLSRGRLLGFREKLSLSRPYTFRSVTRYRVPDYFELLAMIVFVALSIWALTRGRHGLQPDWSSALLVGVLWLPLPLYWIIGSEPIPTGADIGARLFRVFGLTGTYISLLASLPFAAAFVTLAVAAAEILAQDRDLTGFEGLSDLRRGIAPPELAIDSLIGFGAAGTLLGCHAMVQLLNRVAPNDVHVDPPRIFDNTVPGLAVFADLAQAISWTIAAALVSGFLRRQKVHFAIVCAAVGGLALLWEAGTARSLVEHAETVGLAMAIAVISDRCGVLASILAVWLLLFAQNAFALLQTGTLQLVVSACVGIGLLVALAFVAVVSYRSNRLAAMAVRGMPDG